jgi:hypothetical protein
MRRAFGSAGCPTAVMIDKTIGDAENWTGYHSSLLAVFVERGCRFIEKDPFRFVQEEPREGEALLLALSKRST